VLQVAARWHPWWRPGLKFQVVEDSLDHRCSEDGRDDLELAVAVRAVFAVDPEHTLAQPGLGRAP